MKNGKEKLFWDSLSGKYDKFISKYANGAYTKLIKLLKQEVTEQPTVLEIGTGTGIISFALADRAYKITAIDYSEGMIKIANEKLLEKSIKNIEFKICSAHTTDLPDNAFNAIIASNLFHLLPEPEKVLTEIKRLLADNGKLLLATYCHGQNLKTQLLSRLMTLSGFKVANRWTTLEFKNLIVKEGFNIQKEEIIKDKIPLSFIVATKKENHG